MSRLLYITNPNPQTRNWKWIPKKMLLEISTPFITMLAAIESIAIILYITLPAIVLLPFTSKPFSRSFSLLQSSFFTIAWSITLLGINFFTPYLFPQESLARHQISVVGPQEKINLKKRVCLASCFDFWIRNKDCRFISYQMKQLGLNNIKIGRFLYCL